MELRPELMPPPVDEALIDRLAGLADRLDGCRDDIDTDCAALVAQFNREAGTSLPFARFQGVYKWTDPETFVRIVLAEPTLGRVDEITREELTELIRRCVEGEGAEHELSFWLGLLEANLPDPRISDLIHWPGEYFGDGHDERAMSPEEILEIALAAGKRP